jgi:hypothetical protein
MNIFALHPSPIVSAQWLCNVHVVKMGAEAAEMMLLAHWNGGEGLLPPSDVPLRTRHYNHPCTKWVRESATNYMWLWLHAREIFAEYYKRYGMYKNQQHAYYYEVVHGWLANHPAYLPCDPTKKVTPFAECFQEGSKAPQQPGDVHAKYRRYYIEKEKTIKTPMVWPDQPPLWWHRQDPSLYIYDVPEEYKDAR